MVRRPVLAWGLVLALLLVVLGAAVIAGRPAWSTFLYNVSGEEALPGQIRGGLEWLGNLTRPRPDTAGTVPVANAGASPFGVNTFLEQEVEPAKREKSMQMIADAGFAWIRQEFPWEDIEIHGKGDFEDRRHEPYRSAWEKYDQIVDLAERYDLQIIARLSNPPAWSRAAGDDNGTFAPPDNLDDFGDYAEAVARRYRGRISTYQIWNEPNIYPEWGEQPVDPEAYTELLRVGYTRIKAACPECVVVSGALAQTIPLGPRDLNDFIFLQRMYDAGAGAYFDVLAMQDYGLWSGPTDRRMRARVLNFSRPKYIREIMVENGDASKPLWITEMNWNAPPADLPDQRFGFATPEQQARYAVEAYRRVQREWPWAGVVSFWFFKRATDQEKDQAWYYFRLVEPDFTPLPVYDALTAYFHSDEAHTLYPGVHQEDHWLLTYSGDWQTRTDPAAELGSYRETTDPQAGLSFSFEGRELWLRAAPGEVTNLTYTVDDGAEKHAYVGDNQPVSLFRSANRARHRIEILYGDGPPISIDSLTVK